MPQHLIRQRIQHLVEQGSVLDTDHAAFVGGNRHFGAIRRRRRRAIIRTTIAFAVVLLSGIAGALIDDEVECVYNCLALRVGLPLHGAAAPDASVSRTSS